MIKKKINLAYKDIINKNGWYLPYEILKNSVDEFNKNETELLIFDKYKMDDEYTIIGKVDKINLVKNGISTADITLNNDIDLNDKELFMCYIIDNIERKTKKYKLKVYNELSNVALNYCTIKDKELSCYNTEIKMPPKVSKFIMHKVN